MDKSTEVTHVANDATRDRLRVIHKALLIGLSSYGEIERLDNAVGAVYSGEDAVRVVIEWVEAHSNWDDSVLIVAADHGHYLVVDKPEEIAGTAK